jgi:hypothetical protein
VTAGNLQAAAVYSNANTERLLNRPNMAVVLPQQFGEKTMIVEMKFERILVGELRNGSV